MRRQIPAGLAVIILFTIAGCTSGYTPVDHPVSHPAPSHIPIDHPVTPGTHGPVIPSPSATATVAPVQTPGAVNPAVTQATIGSTICVTGWTKTVRPPESYTEALKRQQIDSGYTYLGNSHLASYEEDHLVPLELGGAPYDPRNLWPEPYAGPRGAHAKDLAENELRREVCDGILTLATARQQIITGWAGLR